MPIHDAPDFRSGGFILTGAVEVDAFSNIVRLTGLSTGAFSDMPAHTFFGNLYDTEGAGRAFAAEEIAGIGLTYDVAIGNGPFPEVIFEGVQSIAATATSHDVDMPSPVAVGDRIVIGLMHNQGGQAITTPAGWTHLGLIEMTANGEVNMYERILDGTSGDPGTTLTFVSAVTSPLLAYVWQIRYSHPTQASEAVTELKNSSLDTTNDLGTLTPSWGIANVLWLTFIGIESDAAAPNITDFPDDFENTGQEQLVSGTATLDGAIGWGSQLLRATSLDPTTYTYGPAKSGAFLVAVPPRPSGAFNVTPGGGLGWDDVLLVDAHSGASNPIIDDAQYLQFGIAAPPASGQIRSNEPFHINVDNTFEVSADDTIDIHGPDTITIECTAGPMDLLAFNSIEINSSDGDVFLDAKSGAAGTGVVDIVQGYLRLHQHVASTPSNSAGEGLIWLKGDTQDRLMYTDDANVDHTLAFLDDFGWDTVLAINNNSGAFNPNVDSGQFMGFGVEGSLPASGQIRANGAFTLNGDAAITMQGVGQALLRSTAGVAGILADASSVSIVAGSGAVAMTASTFVSINNFLRFTEAAASTPSMSAGQGLFWVRNDAPNVPMFTDDTDVDHVLLFAPVPLASLATITGPTALGRTTSDGVGVPTELTPAELGQIPRYPGVQTVATGGTINDLVLTDDTIHTVIFTNSTTLNSILSGSASATGRRLHLFAASGTGNSTNVVNNAAGGVLTTDRMQTPAGSTLNLNNGSGITVTHREGPSGVVRWCVESTVFCPSTTLEQLNGQVVRAALTGAVTSAQNSNTTAFGALSAKSVLANATNASAVPAALAGSAAFQHLRVNSANTALEWSLLTAGDFPAGVVPLTALASQATDTLVANITAGAAVPIAVAFTSIDSASLIWDATTHTFQTAAVTGAVTIAQNGTVAAFGALAAKSVLANATNATAVPAALAGSAAFQHLRVNSANTALEWATLSSGDFSAGVVPITALATQAANTVVANATGSVATPTAFAVGTNTVLGRVASNIVAAQLVNAQITDQTITLPKLATINERRMLGNIESATDEVEALRGDQVSTIVALPGDTAQYVILWEDEDFDMAVDGNFGAVTVTSGNFLPVFEAGITDFHGHWFVTSLNSSLGTFNQEGAGTMGHKGIITMDTGTANGSELCLLLARDPQTAADGEATLDADHVVSMDFYVMLPATTNVRVTIGFGDDISNANGLMGSNSVCFVYDSSTDSSWHAIVRASSTTNDDVDLGGGPTAGQWQKFTIRRLASNSWEFYINNSRVDASTATGPTVGIIPGVQIFTLTAASKAVSVDRVRMWINDAAMIG